MQPATHRLLLTLLLASTVILVSPSTTAQSANGFTEEFEECEQFQVPDVDCARIEYAYSTVGTYTANYVTTAQAHTGSKSLRMTANPTLGTDTATNFNPAGANTDWDCDGGSTVKAVNFWFRMAQLPPAASTNYRFGVGDNGNSWNVGATALDYVGFRISDTGSVRASYKTDGNSPAEAGTLFTGATVDTWYHFEIVCVGTTVIWRELEGESQISATASVTNVLTQLHFEHDAEAAAFGASATIYVDGIDYGAVASDVAGSIFCAAPSEDNFGYDYNEEVEYVEEGESVAVSLEDSFEFSGDSDNTAYLAKAFEPGTKAVATAFRVESAPTITDTDSIFRVAYTTGAATLSQGSSGDDGADMTAASNGEDGGNFNDHVQVWLQEVADHWEIRIRTNVGGAGLTTQGGTVNYGDPDIATTFIFEVNSAATGYTDHPLADREDTPFFGFTGPGASTARLLDPDGDVIIERALPAGLVDAEWKDQWFMGKGDNNLGSAETYLDDNQDVGQDSNSTCIYDLTGTATVVGSSGTTPNSETPDFEPPADDSTCTAIFCPPAAGIGGLSSDSISLFLGIVIVASFAASMSSKTGAGAAGIAIFALLGVFIAYALGYIPLWVILVLFSIGLGAIFLGFSNSGKSEGM